MQLRRALWLVLSAAMMLAAPVVRAADIVDGFMLDAVINDVGVTPRPGGEADGRVKLYGRFTYDTRQIDLSVATITFEALLDELGAGAAGELTSRGDGSPVLPLAVTARNGGRRFQALYETLGAARPSVKFELKRRPRNGDDYYFLLIVKGIGILKYPRLCLDVNGEITKALTTMEMRYTVDDGVEPAVLVRARGNFRCQETDLTRKSSGHNSNLQQAPSAAIRVEETDREAGIFRLDGTGSIDRDGTITSWQFTVLDDRTLGVVQGPITTTTGVTDVSGLAPGNYVARLTVTDDAGLRDSAERPFSVRGSSGGGGGGGGGGTHSEPPHAALLVNLLDRNSGMVLLDARGSFDEDGTIVDYSFSIQDAATGATVHGPVSTTHNVFDLVLPAGEYRGVVDVTDNSGASARATRSFSVRSSGPGSGGGSPEPPTPNLRVETADRDTGLIRLDASDSFDKDGSITSYTFWVTDLATGSFALSPVTGLQGIIERTLPPGDYRGVVEVTDDGGHTAQATRSFSVSGSSGGGGTSPELPTADLDVEIVDRNTGLVRLDATDSFDRDGTIASYGFSVVDTDSDAVVFGPVASAQGLLDVSLAPGDYQGVVDVTDDGGHTRRATRTFSVR